eukprot:9323187-Ditylum_brightwellii.AAC.1
MAKARPTSLTFFIESQMPDGGMKASIVATTGKDIGIWLALKNPNLSKQSLSPLLMRLPRQEQMLLCTQYKFGIRLQCRCD